MTRFPLLTPQEAAALIADGSTIGFSGFTAAGAAKAVPRALAERAMAEHAAGRPFAVGVITGASTGPSLDGSLSKADAILFRTPYQSDITLRKQINKGGTRFFDLHLSQVPQYLRYGFLGPIHWAVVEACDVTDDGEIVLTTSVGVSPTVLALAENILIEWNTAQPAALRGFHDIYQPLDPPRRREIPVYTPRDRIGSTVVKVDASRIRGVVMTDEPDELSGFDEPTEVTTRIGNNVAEFLAAEHAAGRIPRDFLPLQSGVGNIANAVLKSLGDHPSIPAFSMYTEVIQDSVVALLKSERVTFASGVSLTLSPEGMENFQSNLEHYRPKVVLRPQEIANNPEVVRRLGVISINTALEVDLFGNVNSSHVLGKQMMNGIGGSGDFTRNAYLSIFTCPSTAKGGVISAIVPLCTHLDHSEHSVHVVVTERGVADLRGKSPVERAQLFLDHCAHPSFREELEGYIHHAGPAHTPQTLATAFRMHEQFMETGDMHGVTWAQTAGTRKANAPQLPDAPSSREVVG